MNRNVDVCVVDDASSDDRQPEFDELMANEHGWHFIRNEKRLGAMHSQFNAVEALNPNPEDVLVWLDGDDRLSTQLLWNVLGQHYGAGAMLTYGSYVTSPSDAKCSPARRYPPTCEAMNGYRDIRRFGLRFNHLRTMKFELWRHLDPATDFKDAGGKWHAAGCDAAAMIPALELAGGRYRRIQNPLYIYSSDNPASDWRTNAAALREVHSRIMSQAPKDPL